MSNPQQQLMTEASGTFGGMRTGMEGAQRKHQCHFILMN
jgi:hypothetical protein